MKISHFKTIVGEHYLQFVAWLDRSDAIPPINIAIKPFYSCKSPKKTGRVGVGTRPLFFRPMVNSKGILKSW